MMFRFPRRQRVDEGRGSKGEGVDVLLLERSPIELRVISLHCGRNLDAFFVRHQIHMIIRDLKTLPENHSYELGS